ncbi:single-stranded DNA-binding protein [Nocardioides rubriscoriae]|uniref:single-stranded DNA-binding protein n=1 Tax=Nocardioides rubriscoriae TaxID=642762 RepID=UPI0011DFDCA9|nr:single-stranded DNA-binding protein [Nocardioides rubriscoriae]
MFNETMVTLQGRVGGDVVLRQAGGAPVANFRVACTPRRLDRATNAWSDGPTQWYSVSAWRALAEHCAASLHRGDAVVIHGKLDMRTYINKAGVETLDVQLEAMTVGHDLCRGTSTFHRARAAQAVPGPAEAAAA